MTYFQLRNNYALTVYRSQSNTLDKCVIHFKRFCYGGLNVIYTALSRSRRLEDVVIVAEKPLKPYFFHQTSDDNV